jgi:acetyl esterase/lipase
MLNPIQDWDDAFANAAYIAGSDALPDQWQQAATSYRASGIKIDENILYGDSPRTHFDLIWPNSPPKGLAVFVHGGYWMMLDKSYWTHLAQGARANGWAVCIPSYSLAPHARISDITREVAMAISHAANLVSGPVTLAGHSAGGHLVARMMCADTTLDDALRDRIMHCLSISGVHDLRPLLQTKMNATLKLEKDEATRESPALRQPARATPVTCWVGCCERPEFLRQSQLFTQIWQGLDVPITNVADRGRHHFDVLDGLCEPDSAITQAFIGAR